jgi:lipopolysaccharide/colanic/teichoic acid biosynthesis glycosyltransferase
VNDFRITRKGEFLRKSGLDELPMIINYLKGELKIVGVRPLSRQYFELYPLNLRQLRIKYKPGLIPPYYVDLPNDLDGIINSEFKYLESYARNPWITDLKYFFKAYINILFHRARSR